MSLAGLPGAFVASAALLVFGALLALRTLEHARGARSGPVGLGLIGLGVAVALWIAGRAELPGTPLAEADVLPAGPTLTVPPHDAPVVLELHGTPKHAAQGESSRTGYVVVAREGSHEVLRSAGAFEEHWGNKRVGRKLTVPAMSAHTDDRLVLAPATAPSTVSLEKVDGELEGPVHAIVVSSPPDAAVVLAVAAVGAITGGVFDAIAGGGTALATFGTFVGLFGWLSTSLTPEADPRAAFTAAAISFAGAALVGPLVRRAAHKGLSVSGALAAIAPTGT